MKTSKGIGIALALGACAWLSVRAVQTHSASAAFGDARAALAHMTDATHANPSSRFVLHVPALAGDVPQPFALDEATIRRAVHEGQLRVALSGGATYTVRIEQQSKDAFGHWNVVGRVASALGPQAMVLTFGQGAVFGALPAPDGRMLQIATSRGRTTIDAPSGAARLNVPTAAATGPTSAALVASAAGTTPVDIRVLGLYGDDMVALRGSEATVQTEIANSLAVATQAHIDSGSRVRFTLAGTFAIHRNFPSNAEALAWISVDEFHDKGVFAKRDQLSADLATLVRVRSAEDTTCGAANTMAGNMTRNATQDGVGGISDVNGYSVVDTAPCGPYTMAHQLGHNLGAADDRLTEMTPWGEQKHGAYPSSFGYVKEGSFATIMSEPGTLPVLGVYSTPMILTCMGGPCGIPGEADNVTTMNLLVDQVAQFRGTPNTLSLGDAVAWEPANGAAGFAANIPLRYAGVANGQAVTVRVIGGTAVAGVDYQMPAGNALQTNMAGEVFVPLTLLGDGVADGEKTVVLRTDPVANVTTERATATLTIHDSDPRAVLSGRVRFGEGVTPGNVTVKAFRANGNVIDDKAGYMTVIAQAPEYAFAFPVVRGASVRLEMQGKTTAEPGVSLWAHPVFVNDVAANRYTELLVERTVPFNARKNNGDVPDMSVMSRNWTTATWSDQPTTKVLPGDRVRIQSRTGSGDYGQVVDEVTAPLGFIVSESTGVLVYLDAERQSIGEGDAGTRDALFDIRLSKASASPVQIYYRTVDGTATAGSDYVATSSTLVTIPAGSTRLRVRVPVKGDTTPEHGERFEVQIVSVVGATASSTRLHMTIADDDRRTGGPGQKNPAQ